MRAIERATEAVMANPRKSNRYIAAHTGLALETIRRARKRVPSAEPDLREGLDGRTRRLPRARARPPVHCDRCGGYHGGKCLNVLSIEYEPGGSIRRVLFINPITGTRDVAEF